MQQTPQPVESPQPFLYEYLEEPTSTPDEIQCTKKHDGITFTWRDRLPDTD